MRNLRRRSRGDCAIIVKAELNATEAAYPDSWKDGVPEWIQMGNFPGIPNRCAPYFRKSGV